MKKVDFQHCFLNRRKQTFKLRKLRRGMTKSERLKLLFIRSREPPPSDPEKLADAPHIDAIFRSSTQGKGFSIRLLMKNHTFHHTHLSPYHVSLFINVSK